MSLLYKIEMTLDASSVALLREEILKFLACGGVLTLTDWSAMSEDEKNIFFLVIQEQKQLEIEQAQRIINASEPAI